MFLTEPAIGVSLSPNWAQLLNADMGIIDSHNHTPGSGVQIPPSGLDINANLTFQGNSAINLNYVSFLSAVTVTPPDLSIWVNGTDLFYTDSSGNTIQLTKNHQPNTSTGNIQGLPSTPTGGAGISWINATSTFVFSQDSGAPGANIDIGSLIIRYPGSYPSPSGNYIALEAPSTLATGYAITLPAALPASTNLVTLNSSGQLAGVPPDGSTIAISGGYLSLATQTFGQSSTGTAMVTTSTPTFVTGTSATVMCTGTRAVLVTLTGTAGYFTCVSSGGVGGYNATVAIYKDGTLFSSQLIGNYAGADGGGSQIVVPSSTLTCVDPNPTAGNHIYNVFISTGTNCGSVTATAVQVTATQL
jgi:hypothetical protein